MRILDHLAIAEAFGPPIDLSGGANDGDWIHLGPQFRNVVCVLRSGIGTAGQDPTLTMEQATSAAGAGAKALTFTELFVKQAATNLLAVGQSTRITQTAAATYTELTAAEQDALWMVEFTHEMLDVANGFEFIRMRVADVGAAAQLGDALYLLGNPRYPRRNDRLPSALA